MLRKEIVLTVIICLGLAYLVHGVKDLKLKTQFKAAHFQNSDMFECVDVYKQPALQHPLLRNHTIQWHPIVIPRQGKVSASFDGKKKTRSATQNTICPPNTIPIRGNTRKSNAQKGNYRFSYLEVIHYDEDKFRGGVSYISVNNPKVGNGQLSGAGMWIGSDLSDQKNFLKAGWIVNPEVYGDSQTRLSIYWTADGFHKTGCFDLQCPGFVQIYNDMMLGSTLSPVSVIGGDQYEEYFYIFQDKATLHWWLVLTQRGEQQFIGYWPNDIVPRLTYGATVLRFGGSTMSGAGNQFPPMGTGQFPDDDQTHSTYFRKIQFVNNSYVLHPPNNYGGKPYTDNPQCYLVKYDDDGDRFMGHSIFMGGPGGSC